MIESFKHKGLKQLFEDDSPKGVNPDQLRKVRQLLALLDAASSLEGLSLPHFKLHPLKGVLKGCWAMSVNANWRIVFEFEDGVVRNVDLIDYH